MEGGGWQEAIALSGFPGPLADDWVLAADGSVEVEESNRRLVMSGRSLRELSATAPEDPILARPSEADAAGEGREPRVVAILLCAGLSTRSAGRIHPLVATPSGSTLLDVQLVRLWRSGLPLDRVLVLCSPLNRDEIAAHAERSPVASRPALYSCGLVPRLAPRQRPAEAPRPARPPSWNPAGHLDALRWLVISGRLERPGATGLLLVYSFTNLGRVASGGADRAASMVRLLEREPAALAVVETTRRPASKRTGSLLVRDREGTARLVKRGWAPGAPAMPSGDGVMMSTNTWWILASRLWRRLAAVLPEGEAGLGELLAGARRGRRRAEAAALFDRAVPAGPILSRRRAAGRPVIQVERDLDQLALLPGRPIVPLAVDGERAVSVKSPVALRDRRLGPFLEP